MIARDRILAVERGRDRDLQCLRERHQLGLRTRCMHAAAGDDHRPLRLLETNQRRPHAGVVGTRTERRNVRKTRLRHGLHLGLIGVDLALIAAELQMHRAWRA